MRYSASLLFLLVGIVACEGDAGPAGPPGEDGAANIASGTFTVAPSAYVNGFWHFPVDGGTQANPAKVATISIPAITSDILANGVVLVYLRIPSTPVGAADQWTLLPFHQGGFGGGYLVSIKAGVKAGEIRIGYSHETTGPTTAPNVYTATLPTYEFRWVAIEGTVGAAVSRMVATPESGR
ncbi:MAG TPA: hypothetical protein VF128_15805 [Gemmatimonadaceae bacterium]